MGFGDTVAAICVDCGETYAYMPDECPHCGAEMP